MKVLFGILALVAVASGRGVPSVSHALSVASDGSVGTSSSPLVTLLVNINKGAEGAVDIQGLPETAAPTPVVIAPETVSPVIIAPEPVSPVVIPPTPVIVVPGAPEEPTPVVPAPALPEVIVPEIPSPVVLPEPATPEVVPEPVVLPEAAIPEVVAPEANPVDQPESIVLPAPAVPEVAVPNPVSPIVVVPEASVVLPGPAIPETVIPETPVSPVAVVDDAGFAPAIEGAEEESAQVVNNYFVNVFNFLIGDGSSPLASLPQGLQNLFGRPIPARGA